MAVTRSILNYVVFLFLGNTLAHEFHSTLNDFKSTSIRRYTFQSKSDLQSCCIHNNDNNSIEQLLKQCLYDASNIMTISELIHEKKINKNNEKECIGVTMMTSARLSESYSLYSEASTALWVSSSSGVHIFMYTLIVNKLTLFDSMLTYVRDLQLYLS